MSTSYRLCALGGNCTKTVRWWRLVPVRLQYGEILMKSPILERLNASAEVFAWPVEQEMYHLVCEVCISRLRNLLLPARACKLLQAGDVIFIDGGTTTYHTCFHLPKLPLHIVTNSLRLSAYLDHVSNRHAEWEVYLTGGRIHHGHDMLTGSGTLHSLDFYHADWAFLSVSGLTIDGLYNSSEAVVETERKMLDRCDRAVVLADQSKLGQRAMCRVCGLGRIDRLIVTHLQGVHWSKKR